MTLAIQTCLTAIRYWKYKEIKNKQNSAALELCVCNKQNSIAILFNRSAVGVFFWLMSPREKSRGNCKKSFGDVYTVFFSQSSFKIPIT